MLPFDSADRALLRAESAGNRTLSFEPKILREH